MKNEGALDESFLPATRNDIESWLVANLSLLWWYLGKNDVAMICSYGFIE
jgi:hypothetical protein